MTATNAETTTDRTDAETTPTTIDRRRALRTIGAGALAASTGIGALAASSEPAAADHVGIHNIDHVSYKGTSTIYNTRHRRKWLLAFLEDGYVLGGTTHDESRRQVRIELTSEGGKVRASKTITTTEDGDWKTTVWTRAGPYVHTVKLYYV